MHKIEYWILHGDNMQALSAMPDDSIDCIVTDPPYGLGTQPDAIAMLRDWLDSGHHDKKGRGFMGKSWDAFVPQPAFWSECYRVLKPGAHVLAFSGARTNDLATLAMRIAGFEIRDCLMWVYGSGFPKALDIGKQIDMMAGAVREKGKERVAIGMAKTRVEQGHRPNEVATSYDTGPAITELAQQWDGWKTQLKPGYEPIALAQKPVAGTITENVLRYGVGALNIEACRVGDDDITINRFNDGAMPFGGAAGMQFESVESIGRYPANFIHDGSPEVEAEFAKYTDDKDTPSRFFYSAKCQTHDRDEGLMALKAQTLNRVNSGGLENDPKFAPVRRKNNHPTVKPTELMQYLIRLIVPKGAIVLDPFCGSGSTGKAAMLEGMNFIGCEMDHNYVTIAEARCEYARRIYTNTGTQQSLL